MLSSIFDFEGEEALRPSFQVCTRTPWEIRRLEDFFGLFVLYFLEPPQINRLAIGGLSWVLGAKENAYIRLTAFNHEFFAAIRGLA